LDIQRWSQTTNEIYFTNSTFNDVLWTSKGGAKGGDKQLMKIYFTNSTFKKGGAKGGAKQLMKIYFTNSVFNDPNLQFILCFGKMDEY
jgi:hypothetical protein